MSIAIPLIDIFGRIVDKVIPDPGERARLQVELAKLADQENQRASNERIAQINLNGLEAQSGNMFTAGWRPAVGWICAAGVAYSFVVQPLASWVATVAGFDGSFPDVSTADLMVLLTGMLGFGGLRTYEKKNNIADNTAVAQTTVGQAPVQAEKPKSIIPDWLR